MYFGLAVLVAGGGFGRVKECLRGQVAASRGESLRVDVEDRVCERPLGGVGVGRGVETFCAVGWDEACVAREVRVARLDRFLSGEGSTGL